MSLSDDDDETATIPGLHGVHHNQALRDIYSSTRDIEIDRSNGQRFEWHFHPNPSPGGSAPGGRDDALRNGREAPSSEQPGGITKGGTGHRLRRPWYLAVAIGAAVVLVAGGLIVTSSRAPATSPSAQTPVTTVQMLGSDALFNDPSVVQELKRQGIVVQQTLRDSRAVCSDAAMIAGYDLSDTSEGAAPCYEELAQKAGKNPDVYNAYGGLMVIVTYTPIVALLERLHIAHEAHGITVFNVAEYLKVFASRKRWTDIPGNKTYPSNSRILLWTTDPKESDLGEMLADILYAAQNGDGPPISIGPHDLRVPVISNLFANLGTLQNYSLDLLEQVLSGGMGECPMATVYESQYLTAVLTGEAQDPNLTFMYPTPDASSEATLVAWTPAGKKLIDALKSPAMAATEEAEGDRTAADKARFVRYMAGRGIAVPDLDELEQAGIQSTNLPTPEILQELVNAVATSQPS
jgi:hypothetical protein